MNARIYVLGVDGGVSGAWALLGDDGSLSVIDTPTRKETINGSDRNRVDLVAMQGYLRFHQIDLVAFEKGQEIPRVGSDGRRRAQSGLYDYGFCNGLQLGCVATLGIEWEIVEPGAWKRRLQLLGKDKDASLVKAIELFGANSSNCEYFKRKSHHNRAEAALIAYDAMIRHFSELWYGPH